MSLVENLINQITTQGLGGITKPLGFDMNDDTFANLLEKQMHFCAYFRTFQGFQAKKYNISKKPNYVNTTCCKKFF